MDYFVLNVSHNTIRFLSNRTNLFSNRTKIIRNSQKDE